MIGAALDASGPYERPTIVVVGSVGEITKSQNTNVNPIDFCTYLVTGPFYC